MKKQVIVGVTVFLLAIGTTTAWAQDEAAVNCQLGGSAVAGMVVHLDPRTGRPTSRPLPEQAAEIAKFQAAHANRSAAGLVQEMTVPLEASQV